MKRFSYVIALLICIASGNSLLGMEALRAKQMQLTQKNQLGTPSIEYHLPEPQGAPVGDGAFFAEVKRLRALEASNIQTSWIPRAEYAYGEVKKLENQLNDLRKQAITTAQERGVNDLAKQKLKDAMIKYAQAALEGYNKNYAANEVYKKENSDNQARFNALYNYLKRVSGWWGFEVWWRSSN